MLLHITFLVIAGLLTTGVLSAIFEQIGIKKPYWARTLAAACVLVSAVTHSWARLWVAIALGIIYTMVRRELVRKKEQKESSIR